MAALELVRTAIWKRAF